MTTKTTFKINRIAETIEYSKASLKRASIPNSKECKELDSLMAKYPSFKLVERKSSKKTYKGLNVEAIRSFVSNNDESKLPEFENILKKDGFPLAKSWFIKTFPTFTMKEVHKAKTEVKLRAVKKNNVASISTAKVGA